MMENASDISDNNSSSSSTTTTQTIRKSDPDDALRIRKNLMLKLGVNASSSKQQTTVQSSIAKRREPSRGGSMLGKVQLSIEPLKGNEKEDERVNFLSSLVSFFKKQSSSQKQDENTDDLRRQDDTPTSTTTDDVDDNDDNASLSSTSEGSTTTSRKLTFNEEVSVCPIPKREEYSNRIRNHLWSSPHELMLNCERNSIEFAAEGWDWRNSLEDDQMYRCVATNELIHPVHVEGLLIDGQ